MKATGREIVKGKLWVMNLARTLVINLHIC